MHKEQTVKRKAHKKLFQNEFVTQQVDNSLIKVNQLQFEFNNL